MSRQHTNGLRRLTPQETAALLDDDREPVGTIVDQDAQPVDEPIRLPIAEPTPVAPAQAKLPVSKSPRIGEIRSEGEAVVAGLSSDYVEERLEVEEERAVELAKLSVFRKQEQVADERVTEVKVERDDFVASLPTRVRRRIGQKLSRVASLTPWAMWVADTLLIANAYGVFGSVALPFPQSESVSNAVQLLRAAAVSFGLVFGLRMVGGRLRDRVEELRERWQPAGHAGDGAVIALVIATAVMLAFSVAQLQQAFLDLTLGGTQVHVPTSVLMSLVVFLGAVSLAAGYFSAEPELARLATLDEQLAKARAELGEARDRAGYQLGVVRALRAHLAAVREAERLDLAEQQAHTERRVYAHVGGNPDVYGVELGDGEAAVPGAA